MKIFLSGPVSARGSEIGATNLMLSGHGIRFALANMRHFQTQDARIGVRRCLGVASGQLLTESVKWAANFNALNIFLSLVTDLIIEVVSISRS